MNTSPTTDGDSSVVDRVPRRQQAAYAAAAAADVPQRALLVGVGLNGVAHTNGMLDELDSLARSAGVVPIERVSCRRPRQDPALYIGSGKAEEIAALIGQHAIDLIIFDNALSAVQQRNLNNLWERPVFDRTELILAIFGQRARSHEGKLQVELASIQHQVSRLVRGWSHLERQRGGVGLRGGPGEKQIELDRRMLDAKAKQLRTRLAKMEKQRQTRRRARDRSGLLKISLVGYTNAGKSTLFNRLTGAQTYAADQLFATLDTLSRRVFLPDGDGHHEVVVSDTVGFVRDLPHQLVEAFRATLDETADADLLIHVVDSSADDRDEQIAQVNLVLEEIGAADVPMITVYNKIDRVGRAPGVESDPCGNIDRVWLSAATGEGLQPFLRVLADRRSRLLTPENPTRPSAHVEDA